MLRAHNYLFCRYRTLGPPPWKFFSLIKSRLLGGYMFCRNCGQTVLETTPFCGQCGTAVVAPGASVPTSGTGAAAAVAPAAVNLTKSIRDEVQSRTKDAWQGIKLFIKSPVG